MNVLRAALLAALVAVGCGSSAPGLGESHSVGGSRSRAAHRGSAVNRPNADGERDPRTAPDDNAQAHGATDAGACSDEAHGRAVPI